MNSAFFIVFKLPFKEKYLMKLMDAEVPLQEILTQGRLLESDWYDKGGKLAKKKIRLYRKVLQDYNPKTKKVLLSKLGSQRLLKELGEIGKRFSFKELYEKAEIMNWKVRGKDYKLH